jgi:uncharacterized protein (TIGR00730 family)
MPQSAQQVTSVCVYCGSSDLVDPGYLAAAAELGGLIAQARLKLVYGGGGVGLMGATARGAHEAGGKVLGIIPDFLKGREQPFDDVETVVVPNMHERKMMMFQQADSFVVLPGGIGTLEEIVELLSWRRLDLHCKPIVFLNQNGFYNPLYALFEHTVERGFTPAGFSAAWRSVDTPAQVVPAIRAMAKGADLDSDGPPKLG